MVYAIICFRIIANNKSSCKLARIEVIILARYTKKKSLIEKLYRSNVLPDGNLNTVNPIDVVKMKLEDPPFDDKEEKGSV